VNLVAGILTYLTATVKVIQSLTDDKKTPLHVGEVMSLWMYLAFVEEIINYEQVALNTTSDHDLKKVFQEAIKIAESHKEELKEFLQKEVIPLPTEPQEKPPTEDNLIPIGTKFTDSELVNALAINLATVTTMCAQSASQTIRNDVALLFLKYQLDKMMIGAKVKKLMKERGWLKIPPYYYSPGKPQKSN
jgi:hypothetical protein